MTISSTPLLNRLLSSGKIALQDDPFLSHAPRPLPAELPWERVEGMLLGLAVGDALGNTSEGLLPSERYKRYGEIRNYLPNYHVGGRAVGLPSDDSQMAFWTLEQLLADDGLVPDHLAQRFSQEQIFGIGNTVRGFLQAYKDSGLPWEDAGQPSAGNGALMRIAPVLLPHLRRPSPDLWADAALAGMITHNDRASNACCVAFVHLLWEALQLTIAPEPPWWLETFCQVASQLEVETGYRPRLAGMDYAGPVWRFADQEVRRALVRGETSLQACNRWGSGAYLLETVPSALYILCLHGHDLEEAIVRAVNDTKDNDSIAAIVGAAVGALHGKDKMPSRWLKGLLGRTGTADDGRIFELLAEAQERFFQARPP